MSKVSKERQFLDYDDNAAAAFETLQVETETSWAELEPTGTCYDSGTLLRFDASDFDGRLDYFIDLNYEDEIYARSWHRESDSEIWTETDDVVIRKYVIIHGTCRNRDYDRETVGTLKDTVARFQNMVTKEIARFTAYR